MKKLSFLVLSACVLTLGLRTYAEQAKASTAAETASASASAPVIASGATARQAQAAVWAPPHTQAPASLNESQTALVKQYCATCHNDRNKNNAGGLSLASFDAAKVGHDAEVA